MESIISDKERKEGRLIIRTGVIFSLPEKFKVKKLTDYQFRINGLIDLYPTNRRFFHLKKKTRGNYPDTLKELIKFLEISTIEGKEVRWIDAETQKPKSGDKIIFECAIGLYWGIFESTKNKGCVAVEGKQSDKPEWNEIYRWILYPAE